MASKPSRCGRGNTAPDIAAQRDPTDSRAGGDLAGLFEWIGESALASPAATLRYAVKLATSDTFIPHLRETMIAFAAGYALAVSLGLVVGFWLGFHRLSGEVMEPMVVAIYSLPKVTLYPILLLAFGLGISAKIAFGTLHGVIPIILFTLSAVRNVRPILLKTGRVLKLTPPQMVRSILFPACCMWTTGCIGARR